MSRLEELQQSPDFERARRVLSWEGYLDRYQQLLADAEVSLEDVTRQFITDADIALATHYEEIQEHNKWQADQR